MRSSVLVAAITTLGVVNGRPQVPGTPCVQQPAGLTTLVYGADTYVIPT